MMKTQLPIKLMALALVGLLTTTTRAATTLSGEEALTALKDGNTRYTAGKPLHPNQDAARRTTVAKGQNPFVTVLTCSDSRVPAELIFDQGIGDTFVVRVAGNVSDTDEVGTIEYGVGHLNTPLLVVMGHTSCGAVKAVLEGAQVHGSIPALVDNIAPAVVQTKAANPSAGAASLLGEVVKANVWISIDDVFKRSTAVRDLVRTGKLKVTGAVYDLESGEVNWLGTHPEQARLLAYTGSGSHSSGPSHSEDDPPTGTVDHAVTGTSHSAEAIPASAATTTAHADAAAGTATNKLTWYGTACVILTTLMGAIWWFIHKVMPGWTIQRRIVAGFCGVLAATVILAIVCLRSLFSIDEDAAFARKDAIPGTVAILELDNNFKAKAGLLEKYVHSPNKAAIDRELKATQLSIDKQVQSYEASITVSVDREMFDRLKKVMTDFDAVGRQMVDFGREGRVKDAEKLAETAFESAQISVSKELETLTKWNESNAFRSAQEISDAVASAERLAYMTSLGAILIAVAFGWLVSRDISRVLREVTENLSAGADQTAAAASQVAAASQTLAEGASEQAASLEETSASLEEMTSMVRRNAEAANKAKVLANETRTAADAGTSDMAEMKAAMNEIKTSSAEVAKIVKDIDEIAFQTNILALNAAVEAARAGEAGMGFAVVAEEVRNLAQRSAKSAKETASKIEDAIAKSERGVQISQKVANSFDQIATKTREVDQFVAEIAGASNEQSQGIGQVNTAVTQMDKVTQSNAASAEESASASEELSGQSESVKASVRTLQQLVGGGTETSTTGRTMSATARTTRNIPRLSNQTKPVRGKNSLLADQQSAETTAAATPKPSASIGDEFKDF